MDYNLINQQALANLIEAIVTQKVMDNTKAIREELELLKKQTQVKSLLTVEEASDYMGKKISTIRNLARSRSIPYFKEGKRIYFHLEDLNNYLSRNRIKSAEELNNLATHKYYELKK